MSAKKIDRDARIESFLRDNRSFRALQNVIRMFNNNPDKVWVISDTHFFHERLAEEYSPKRQIYKEYGYANFDDFMVDMWNKYIKRDDIVIHLGDFVFKNVVEFFEEYELNGKIILIAGNHDVRHDKTRLFRNYCKVVIDFGVVFVGREPKPEVTKTIGGAVNGLILEINRKRIMLSHIPVVIYEEEDRLRVENLREIYDSYGCVLNIHGHEHHKLVSSSEVINMAVELVGFKPRKLKDILVERKVI